MHAVNDFSIWLEAEVAQICAGQMKDILTTGLGMFIFGDVKFEPKNVIGVAVGLTGGILYAYFSYRDSQQKDAVNTFYLPFACRAPTCICQTPGSAQHNMQLALDTSHLRIDVASGNWRRMQVGEGATNA